VKAVGRAIGGASNELKFNFPFLSIHTYIYPADLFLIFDAGHAFSIIGLNKQMLYEYVGNVLVGAKPQDEGHQAPPTTGWIVRGKLTLQRQSELALAAAVSCLGSVNVPGMFSFRKCFGLSPATRTMINSIPLGIIFLFILKKRDCLVIITHYVYQIQTIVRSHINQLEICEKSNQFIDFIINLYDPIGAFYSLIPSHLQPLLLSLRRRRRIRR